MRETRGEPKRSSPGQVGQWSSCHFPSASVGKGPDVSVIDPAQQKKLRRTETANGTGMVLFRPDGKYAFVPSSFTPEMDVIDMATYQVGRPRSAGELFFTTSR